MSLINKNEIVLTGGIGDVIAIDSHLTHDDRSRIHKIYWAAKNSKFAIELINGAKKFFPNLKKNIIAWNQFDLFHGLGRADWLNKFCQPPDGFNEAEDLSIHFVFPKIILENLPFTGSCLLQTELDKLNIKLPSEYLCICPTTNNAEGQRDFSELEMIHLLKWLQHTKQQGVVIGSPYINMPKVPMLLNLTGQTTICQSVEIMKRAYGYIGIDSWLSILAAQLFKPENLLIKSKNLHLFIFKNIYYRPHESYSFVKNQIDLMAPDPVLSSMPSIPLDGNSMRWCHLNDLFYQTDLLSIKNCEDQFTVYKAFENKFLELNQQRSELVMKYCEGPVLDIGIGSGLFLKIHPVFSYGFDICQSAVDWLKKDKRLINPWYEEIDVAGYCFWDSLSHIAQPSVLLSKIPLNKFVFISLPFLPKMTSMPDFDVIGNAIKPRMDERLHHWTDNGLIGFMSKLGFKLVDKTEIAMVFHHEL